MYLNATGMICPVGLSARPACAAIRAGISAFAETPFADSRGRPVVGASVPSLPHELMGSKRLVELLVAALGDCLRDAVGARSAAGGMPLFVGLPARPASDAAPELEPPSLVRLLSERVGVQFHAGLSRTFPIGHTSSFRAIAAAREVLNRGDAPVCVVCAADSLMSAPLLLALERQRRLRTEDNSDGSAPGEAGAAVVVGVSAEHGASRVGDGIVRVAGLGFGNEDVGVLSDEPLRGHGMTDAMRRALADAALSYPDLDFRLSDVSGESYGLKEQALVMARLLRVGRTSFPIWHCADCIGETGAASGLCQVVIALDAFNKAYSPGEVAALHSSAAGGDRAVLILRHEPSGAARGAA